MRAFDPARPIAIVGAGVMGTKVAWACARSGIPTRLFDAEQGKAERAAALAGTWGTAEEQAAVARSLRAAGTLGEALDGVQLAFENVPERLALKQEVLGDLGRKAPADAYMGTNASSIPCTPLAQAAGRPELFFNLNFTDPRTDRLTELMVSPATAPETREFAKAWAHHIGMVPIECLKEQLGYSFNRLWRVIKREVLRQVAEGYATPESIDRAWMLTYGTDMGPCGIMDEIGLHTVLGIEKVYHQDSGDPRDAPPAFLEAMVKAGKLGVASGQGFYSHPDPAYRRPDFLTGDG